MEERAGSDAVCGRKHTTLLLSVNLMKSTDLQPLLLAVSHQEKLLRQSEFTVNK